jgi:Heterokaryon incompatibility protein (HET)
MVGLELDGLAKAWINNCIRSHLLYLKPQNAILPTRLLNIGDSVEPLESLYLVVPEEVTEGTWIVLSYCWGKTKDLQDHLRQIQFKKLPLTIQDAIHVTKGLCVRYLWVDVLCIVRDLNKD